MRETIIDEKTGKAKLAPEKKKPSKKYKNGGEVKGYMDGGEVEVSMNNSPNSGLITTKGFGASRKT